MKFGSFFRILFKMKNIPFWFHHTITSDLEKSLIISYLYMRGKYYFQDLKMNWLSNTVSSNAMLNNLMNWIKMILSVIRNKIMNGKCLLQIDKKAKKGISTYFSCTCFNRRYHVTLCERGMLIMKGLLLKDYFAINLRW